jgi:hypothetical protein
MKAMHNGLIFSAYSDETIVGSLPLMSARRPRLLSTRFLPAIWRTCEPLWTCQRPGIHPENQEPIELAPNRSPVLTRSFRNLPAGAVELLWIKDQPSEVWLIVAPSYSCGCLFDILRFLGTLPAHRVSGDGFGHSQSDASKLMPDQ